MQVFRVEHKVTGAGPYRFSDRDNSHFRDEGGAVGWGGGDRYPCFRRDTKLYKNFLVKEGRSWDSLAQYSFGFESMKQLQNWFHTKIARNALIKDGFVIAVYDVSDEYVTKGGKQIVFRKDKSTLLNHISFKDI